MRQNKPVEMDAETAAFAERVRLSLLQAKAGLAARTYTPEDLQTLKAKRGRPRGSKQATVKVPTTLRLDEAALARWRASGKGWQTRAALVLAQHAPG
jgi:uncharacterized protein (DUF4415 family)